MVQYPDCPFCGNSNLLMVDVVIDGIPMKGIQCSSPNCQKYVGFFEDYNLKIKSIEDSVEELTGRIDDIED